MYHIELRQFPHNVCQFNLTGEELRAIVEPWAREQVVEVGERKWSPHQARLTILEGPRLGMEELTMGRGWRAAQRQSQDVTAGLLAAATQALAASSAGASAARLAATARAGRSARRPPSARCAGRSPIGRLAPRRGPRAAAVGVAGGCRTLDRPIPE